MAVLPGVAIFLSAMAFAYFVASWLLKVPAFSRCIESDSQRYETLDGLRGYLALSVLVHHFFVHSSFLANRGWVAPHDPFLAMAGSAPVQIFFAITGFLFWSRAIRGGGEIAVRPFAINRLFRIAPLYLVVMAVAYGLAFLQTGGKWQGEFYETYQAVLRTFTFGGFVVESFNGIELMPITAGVAWTLVYEWGFYVALPVLAWFAVWPRTVFLATGFMVLLAITSRPEVTYSSLFLVGIVAAQWLSTKPDTNWARQSWASWAVAALLAALYLAKRFEPYAAGFLLILPAFAAIASGNDLFGLLRRRASKLLGAASYSIYLIHGPLLYLCFHKWVGTDRFLALGDSARWIVLLGVTALVTLVSCCTYAWIELPMIRLGHRIAGRVGVRPPDVATVA